MVFGWLNSLKTFIMATRSHNEPTPPRAHSQDPAPTTVDRHELASWTGPVRKTLYLSAECASRPVSRGGGIRPAGPRSKHAAIPDAICRRGNRQHVHEIPLRIPNERARPRAAHSGLFDRCRRSRLPCCRSASCTVRLSHRSPHPASTLNDAASAAEQLRTRCDLYQRNVGWRDIRFPNVPRGIDHSLRPNIRMVCNLYCFDTLGRSVGRGPGLRYRLPAGHDPSNVVRHSG